MDAWLSNQSGASMGKSSRAGGPGADALKKRRLALDAGGRVATAHEDAAPGGLARRHAVDPAHRVGEGAALRADLEELIEVLDADGLHLDVRVVDARELQLAGQDETRQAHAAHGGPEQLGLFVRAAGDHAAVGDEQLDPADVVAEAAVDVMVLAVDVAGDGAPDRHELRAGHHRREEPARHEGVQDLLEGDPGLTAQPARLGVEVEHAVEAAGENDAAIAQQRGVAVTAAETEGQHGVALPIGQGGGHLFAALGAGHLRLDPGIAAPTPEGLRGPT
jgi:hypothetical protein